MKEEDRVNYLRKLAERFFLSYEMVAAARGVFDVHRRLDLPAKTTALSTAPATTTISATATATTVVEPTGEQRTTSPVCRRLSVDADAPEAVASDVARVPVAVWLSGLDSDVALPASDVPIGHRLHACMTTPESYTVPWEGDERIGVVGLEAALGAMGCQLSRLEVVDLMDAVHGKVALIDTAYRAVQDEQERALQERHWQQQLLLEGATPRHGQHSRAGSVASARSSSAPRKGAHSPGRTPRGKGTGAAGSGPSGRESDADASAPGNSGPPQQAAWTAQSRDGDGLTFPEFLHVLQLPLVPEDDTPATRDQLLGAVFAHVDCDHDGVVSEQDVIATLRHLIYDEQVLANDPIVQQLAMMYPTELQTALAECDVDGDGIVTLGDIAAVLH